MQHSSRRAGVAGVFVGCFTAARCAGSLRLAGGRLAVSFQLAGQSGAIVHVPLSASAQLELARRGHLRAGLALTDSANHARHSTTITLLAFQ